ncbi:hypothetical protein CEP48_07185 [Mergibacter septicus]|uniref:Fe-S metabolism associated domain-containing protein n=1 Tax=Mergibacter septicus TaxID=221402 RepID=A0A8D4LML4_9PAST|nr:SufE family protein [Mergibacter septicus]AWX15967.1 hypothetical protein CEP47_07185 [Mergibacter septicus]QDJ15220.1 hypothetical protein CEP48_07185 [Mergibacter septicus]UTU47360.1 SufE family protein [Mergibacter septicus]WMR95460.1 SufE family protein [Mergibacter septicus]
MATLSLEQITLLFPQQVSWEERYRQLILLGKQLEKPKDLTDIPLIPGCESALWFQILPQSDGSLQFKAYSEARILKGLLVILLAVIEGKTAEQLKSLDFNALLTQLGLDQRLSNTRLNGFKTIEQQLRNL